MDFVEIKSLQDPSISSRILANKISNNFNINLYNESVHKTRQQLKFHYRPPQRAQELSEIQKQNRCSFCQNLLEQIEWLQK